MQLSANGNAGWRTAAAHAIPVTALVSRFTLYWFAVADRYIVFLYYHDMGPRVPDTTPFSGNEQPLLDGGLGSRRDGNDDVRSHQLGGRTLGCVVCHCGVGARWASSAIPLVIVLPAITMTVNSPTLPHPYMRPRRRAAALAALAIALATGRMAARQLRGTAWLGLDGLALAVVLLPGVFYYPLLAREWSQRRRYG